MNYSSSYELKKVLKRRGIDLEGIQVKQPEPGQFLIVPLDESLRFARNGNSFVPEVASPENDYLAARLSELESILRGTNVLVLDLTSSSNLDNVQA